MLFTCAYYIYLQNGDLHFVFFENEEEEVGIRHDVFLDVATHTLKANYQST